MLVSLYRCDGCWRVTDNFQTADGTWVICKCGSRFVWLTRPTYHMIFKWILTNPKYVAKLFWLDWRESWTKNKKI